MLATPRPRLSSLNRTLTAEHRRSAIKRPPRAGRFGGSKQIGATAGAGGCEFHVQRSGKLLAARSLALRKQRRQPPRFVHFSDVDQGNRKPVNEQRIGRC